MNNIKEATAMDTFLDFCYKRITSNISEKTLSYFRMGMYFGVFLMAMLYASCLANVHLLVKCLVGVIFMAGLIIFSVGERRSKTRINAIPAVLWIIVGLGQCASCIFASVEYIPMALVWCVGMPLLFFVWNNKNDYWGMFREMSLAGNTCFFIAAVLSIIFFPIDENRYGGVFVNPNGLGQWLVFVMPLVLFLYDNELKPKIKKLYFCEIILIILLTYFSKSRTTIVAVLLMLCLYCTFSLKNKKMCLKKGIKSVASFFAYLVVILILTMGINRLTTNLVDYCDIDVYYLYRSGDSSASNNSEIKPIINNASVIERFAGKDKTGSTANDYSSGRLGIWEAVLGKLNFKGHPSREHIVTDRNGDVGANAHNTVIQYAYDNGIITGVAFLIGMCYAGLQFLIRTLKAKGKPVIEKYYLITFVGYFIVSMLASINLPFLYLISFEFLLTLPILFFKSGEENV